MKVSTEEGPPMCASEQIRAGDSLLGEQLPSKVTGKGRNKPREDTKAITLVRCSKSHLRVTTGYPGWQKQGTKPQERLRQVAPQVFYVGFP